MKIQIALIALILFPVTAQTNRQTSLAARPAMIAQAFPSLLCGQFCYADQCMCNCGNSHVIVKGMYCSE